ncbi:MAG TPA: histidine kinase dimerization/phospho-acceptor domain-containing protein, partial [Pirellulaceae bacterium]|nr:histidine kinase dimerization/phospho-acceptor domain-containing protein [Pirellulaceae bacterium]
MKGLLVTLAGERTMGFSRLFWKLFLVYAGLNLALTGGFLLVTVAWQKDLVLEQARLRLRDSAQALRSQLPTAADELQPKKLLPLLKAKADQTGLQFSLLDAEGQPVGDQIAAPLGSSHPGPTQEIDPATGRPMLYLAVPYPEHGETHGYLQAGLELTSINSSFAAMQRVLWLFTLAGGCLAVVVTYFVVGRIARPLSRLTEGAQAIAAGDDEHPVQVESHDELGLLGAAFNHMQRKLHRRLGQVRENSERLATVLGSMVEGVIAVDPDQKILLANEAGRSLLDFVTADSVGRPLVEVTRTRAVHDAVEEAFEAPQPVKIEFEAPGVTRRVLSLRATKLPGDPCPGVMVVLHDVTELRRLENLRRELVANVSHELKTPLASIKAYAETLRLGAVNDPEHNMLFIGRIEEQADRLHQLILDMIQIARVESGQQTFDITEVEVAGVVDRCINQHRGAAEAKRIQLTVEQPPTPLTVMADDEGVLA